MVTAKVESRSDIAFASRNTGKREIKNIGIYADVGIRDAVALGGRCIAASNVQMLWLRIDVSLFDLAHAGGIGDADCRECVFGILLIKRRQNHTEAAAKTDIERGLARGLGERRSEMHDTEIGIEAGGGDARFRRAEDAFAD